MRQRWFCCGNLCNSIHTNFCPIHIPKITFRISKINAYFRFYFKINIDVGLFNTCRSLLKYCRSDTFLGVLSPMALTWPVCYKHLVISTWCWYQFHLILDYASHWDESIFITIIQLHKTVTINYSETITHLEYVHFSFILYSSTLSNRNQQGSYCSLLIASYWGMCKKLHPKYYDYYASPLPSFLYHISALPNALVRYDL